MWFTYKNDIVGGTVFRVNGMFDTEVKQVFCYTWAFEDVVHIFIPNLYQLWGLQPDEILIKYLCLSSLCPLSGKALDRINKNFNNYVSM